MTKKPDDKNFSYSYDGNNIQYYHTEKSIKDELSEAGLKLSEEMKKVFYPWELTRKYDYGYSLFPKAQRQNMGLVYNN